MLSQGPQGRSQTFPKIDALSTFQFLRGNTKRTSNQYHNSTRNGIFVDGIFRTTNYKLFFELTFLSFK